MWILVIRRPDAFGDIVLVGILVLQGVVNAHRVVLLRRGFEGHIEFEMLRVADRGNFVPSGDRKTVVSFGDVIAVGHGCLLLFN